MATYAVGDIQGRYNDLLRLLDRIRFSPESDRLILLGDLVNRGPNSLDVVRFAMSHASSVRTVLGNHDLYLLGVLENIVEARERDTFTDVLSAPDREEILAWVCRQPLVIDEPELNILAVHAGVHPFWTHDDILMHAKQAEQVIAGSGRAEFLMHMLGNKPRRWSDTLAGWDRMRILVNVFTRMRYVKRNGKLDFKEVRTRGKQQKNLVPWFEFPGRVKIRPTIVFGHWSTLGVYQQPGILAMDSGCCWGRCLSAARLDGESFAITQVACK
ncbi:MAG: symmetrical bis(5'-nucleosyl)-tetraphosphatase [Acidiferrobacterales bacterium]|nr:symmetrical bis(5'-nucleosyl)-tetraphosphatase [Acidiferrobacterales bacterium]